VWRFDFSTVHAPEIVGVSHTSSEKELRSRPCLVISSDGYNKRSVSFTVLGLTTRRSRVWMPNFDIGAMRDWSILISQSQNRWMNVPATLIDCNKLWTTSLSAQSHYIGTLAKEDMARVEHMLLRLFTGEDMRLPTHKPFEDGTIVEMKFSEPGGASLSELFLVVSSPAWDVLRRDVVGTCSVIKIKPFEAYDATDSLQAILDVQIHNADAPTKVIAECSDVFTLQWNPEITATSSINRGMHTAGMVTDLEQLYDVSEKLLWKYLNMPE
jgi:hypothetical protein